MTDKYCINCGKEISKNANFCSNCGYKILEKEEVKVQKEKESKKKSEDKKQLAEEEKTRQCPKCNASLNPKQKECQKCGYKYGYSEVIQDWLDEIELFPNKSGSKEDNQDQLRNKEFEWLSLDKDEEILWSGKPQILISDIFTGIITIPFLIGFIIIIIAYLENKTTVFVVTNQGLYKKAGALSTNLQSTWFENIQNIYFSQGFFGEYFNYGNIEISTAGNSRQDINTDVEMKFKHIENPKKVQNLINQHTTEKVK